MAVNHRDTRNSSRRLSMSWRARVGVSAMASELKRTVAPLAFTYVTMAKSSRFKSGSPTPCRTTRSRTGNWSTIPLSSARVRSFGGSSVRKVRTHVWHFESQRLVVSRYSVRGSVGPSAGRLVSLIFSLLITTHHSPPITTHALRDDDRPLTGFIGFFGSLGLIAG